VALQKNYLMKPISQEVVSRAVEIIGEDGISDVDIEFQLLDIVPDSITAKRLFLFIPEAFGIVLANRIARVTMPTEFDAKNSENVWERFALSCEPVFACALQAAEVMYDSEREKIFNNVAMRSSIMHALNNMVKNGSKMDGTCFTPIAVISIPAEIYRTPKKSMWRKIFGRD